MQPVIQNTGHPGYQAYVKHRQERIYLGTYATTEEAYFAHQLGQSLLGQTPLPATPENLQGDEGQIAEKVKARLAAFASRPGRHHRGPALVRLDSTTGFKGVCLITRPWRAEIKKDRRTYSLGQYRTAGEAALAYNLAATILHGTNVIPNPIPPAEDPGPEKAEAIRKDIILRLGCLITPTPTLSVPCCNAQRAAGSHSTLASSDGETTG